MKGAAQNVTASKQWHHAVREKTLKKLVSSQYPCPARIM